MDGTSNAAGPAVTAELSYAAEAKAAQDQARKKFWRSLWIFVASLLVGAGILSVTANALYRLSIARILYWPTSLVTPGINFHESDPVLSAYVSRNACEPTEYDYSSSSEDEFGSCEIIESLARGEYSEAAKLVQEVDSSNADQLLPSVKAVVAHQLTDSAARRDWATCAQAAWIALQMLEKQDTTPQSNWASDNRLLLQAGSCEFARNAYLSENEYSELARRVASGGHLEDDYIAQLVERPEQQLRAWGHYFDGINKLRARETGPATESFRESLAANPAGLLRELALLGSARALFWRYKLSSFEAQQKVSQSEARAGLQSIAQLIQRKSFRSDVEHYVREVGR